MAEMKSLVLDGASSRAVYNLGLAEFFAWFI